MLLWCALTQFVVHGFIFLPQANRVLLLIPPTPPRYLLPAIFKFIYRVYEYKACMPHARSLLAINRASLFYAIAVKLIVATFSLPLLSLPLSLSCFLAGEDGQTLPINRRQRAYNNGTLIIEQLQRLEDAGTYTCMAQNKQKQTSRRNVEIQVLGEYCVYAMWGYTYCRSWVLRIRTLERDIFFFFCVSLSQYSN